MPVLGMAVVVAKDEFQPMVLVCSMGVKRATCGGQGSTRTPVALTPWVLLLRAVRGASQLCVRQGTRLSSGTRQVSVKASE